MATSRATSPGPPAQGHLTHKLLLCSSLSLNDSVQLGGRSQVTQPGSANWFSVDSGSNSFRLRGPDHLLQLLSSVGRRMKAAVLKSGCGCAPINLYLQKQAWGGIWPMGPAALTPGLSQSFPPCAPCRVFM